MNSCQYIEVFMEKRVYTHINDILCWRKGYKEHRLHVINN